MKHAEDQNIGAFDQHLTIDSTHHQTVINYGADKYSLVGKKGCINQDKQRREDCSPQSSLLFMRVARSDKIIIKH